MNIRDIHLCKIFSEILAHFREAAESPQLAEVNQYIFYSSHTFNKFDNFKSLQKTSMTVKCRIAEYTAKNFALFWTHLQISVSKS